MSTDIFSLKERAATLVAGDLEKAKAMYAWLIEAVDGVSETAKPKAEAKAPKTEKPKDAKPADAPKAEAPKGPPETAPFDADKTALDYQKDVVPKIAAAAAKYGKPALLAVFESEFGASNAKEIPAEKWGALIAAIDSIGADNG